MKYAGLFVMIYAALATVFAVACYRFGMINAFGITAAIWLLMPQVKV